MIEILIVLVLIGIIASFAVLATGDFGETQRIESSAKELDLLINLAQQQAILQPAVLGLSIQAKGYRFFQYQRGWQSMDRDNALFYHPFPTRAAVTLKPLNSDQNLAAPPDSDKPSIIISPSGNITPFIFEIGKSKQAPLFRIIAEQNGQITYTKAK